MIKDDQNKPIVIRRTDKSYLKSNNVLGSDENINHFSKQNINSSNKNFAKHFKTTKCLLSKFETFD